MENTDLDQLFTGYPNVANGVRKMIELWEDGPRTVARGEDDLSLYFVYAVRRHAFRVETATRGRAPRLVIYTGTNDPRRGSPLVKGANAEDVQKLAKDFGIPENKDGRPDWLKSLTETTSTAFYTDFVEHALKMVRRS